MGSKWRKAKMALGLNNCLYVPKTSDDVSPAAGTRASDASLLSPTNTPVDGRMPDYQRPMTPSPSSSGLRLPKNGSKSSKRICSICLTTMKPGQGHALFTAECSHSFHFQCITSNVKHGNQICPICRAKWKEVPFQSPASDLYNRRSRISRGIWPQDDGWMNVVVPQLPHPRLDANRHSAPLRLSHEPSVFDDDELLDPQPEDAAKYSYENTSNDDHSIGAVEIETYPEECYSEDQANPLLIPQNSRAPIDLVTVLDVSGSMAARRLFPLRRMTNTGRQEALQAVNALISNGGTNIAEGLRKGSKVMTDRKWKSPVSSIILLSDGQDTYTISSPRADTETAQQSLLPSSMRRDSGAGANIPVHSFGFGADHDAVSMHSISEASGGTFSFIEAESVIQDAFAQCIGGLLSVVVQELQVVVDCVHPKLYLNSIKAGNYKTNLTADARTGFIEFGDLYAEEERDFLVILNIPVEKDINDMTLVKIKCHYKDPITKETVTVEELRNVVIQRPETTGQLPVSMEVDRQRNRLHAAEAMAAARGAAERSDLSAAVTVLEHCRQNLLDTVSARAGDRLCVALGAELKEMQERMANRRVYESSGRAYVLSGLSSHSWQRATARGDSMDSTSLMHAYQTPSMVEMVTRSQTMFFGNPSSQLSARPARSLSTQPQPR
ncbi:Zinc finger C3HC4-type RING finger family protein [Heracleum sosnowskyi]|uniref:Zinc finger C3HC4-type RING finger family protein n=1 Tax=Heracleum sosnowskyi TaxID=360622 RepID=A0AAD8MHG9_9APIA|nr:Zinc finger C3HC4-type RING finger family protein [Heracleum sosnowskyi]